MEILGDMNMSLLIGLLVVLVVGYLVYRKLNKTADTAFEDVDAPVVEEPALIVESVSVQEVVAAPVKKPRKKRAPSVGTAKRSPKKINSLEK